MQHHISKLTCDTVDVCQLTQACEKDFHKQSKLYMALRSCVERQTAECSTAGASILAGRALTTPGLCVCAGCDSTITRELSQTGKEHSVPSSEHEITANYMLIGADAKNNNIILMKK